MYLECLLPGPQGNKSGSKEAELVAVLMAFSVKAEGYCREKR